MERLKKAIESVSEQLDDRKKKQLERAYSKLLYIRTPLEDSRKALKASGLLDSKMESAYKDLDRQIYVFANQVNMLRLK